MSLKENIVNTLGGTTEPHIFSKITDVKDLQTLMNAKKVCEKYGYEIRLFKKK